MNDPPPVHGYLAGFTEVGPSDLGLKLIDDGNEGLQFVDNDGREYDMTGAFHVLRKEKGLDWIASVCGASVRTADGWCQGRTQRKQALMLAAGYIGKGELTLPRGQLKSCFSSKPSIKLLRPYDLILYHI